MNEPSRLYFPKFTDSLRVRDEADPILIPLLRDSYEAIGWLDGQLITTQRTAVADLLRAIAMLYGFTVHEGDDIPEYPNDERPGNYRL